jgi:hypothetical protein
LSIRTTTERYVDLTQAGRADQSAEIKSKNSITKISLGSRYKNTGYFVADFKEAAAGM